MYPAPSTPFFSQMSVLVFTIAARSAGPKFSVAGNTASTSMYCCGGFTGGINSGFSGFRFASACTCSIVRFNEASSNWWVVAEAVF